MLRVREVEDMIPDVHREIMKKFPGNNKMYCAVLAAFCEAAEHVRFANLVLAEPDLSEDRRWMAHGELYVGHLVIRKIAEQLGVPNEVEVPDAAV